MPVYFYPHNYLRDRQLDTIRNWPREEVLNPQIAQRSGMQVTRETALRTKRAVAWHQRIPVINVKRRPASLPHAAVVYVWGAVMASGSFIVELDNPYALTGYNLNAMALYRGLLRRSLAGPRCLEIRCLSQGCRRTLNALFGEEVTRRAAVHYPYIRRVERPTFDERSGGCRLLFVATQFEVKGGAALVRAFRRLYAEEPSVCLDLVTHLPPEFVSFVSSCPGITVHEAFFDRKEIAERFMRHADILVHPTYMESFGMVVLEAVANGLAVIATDVYAIPEMVREGINGTLLRPPVSIWEGIMPSKDFSDAGEFASRVRGMDTSLFEDDLLVAMRILVRNADMRQAYRRASLEVVLPSLAENSSGASVAPA